MKSSIYSSLVDETLWYDNNDNNINNNNNITVIIIMITIIITVVIIMMIIIIITIMITITITTTTILIIIIITTTTITMMMMMMMMMVMVMVMVMMMMMMMMMTKRFVGRAFNMSWGRVTSLNKCNPIQTFLFRKTGYDIKTSLPVIIATDYIRWLWFWGQWVNATHKQSSTQLLDSRSRRAAAAGGSWHRFQWPQISTLWFQYCHGCVVT